MAQIDERARSLNEPDEPEPDEDQDDVDEDQDDDEDEDQGDEDQEDEEGDEGPAPSRARAGDRGAPALSAGLLVGAVLYTVVIQLIRGGTPQLKGWISAKFINVPWTGSAAAKS